MKNTSDYAPCIEAKVHILSQRHQRRECPAVRQDVPVCPAAALGPLVQPEEPRIVQIDVDTLETLKNAASWRFDGGKPIGSEFERLQAAIDLAETLIDGEKPLCGDPNPLQPALKCTRPKDHGKVHAADSAMGHHEWSPA